jgi:hypothetical protein
MGSRLLAIAVISACGGSSASPDAAHDSPSPEAGACQPLGVTGEFMRRPGNPHLLAGHVFTDGMLDKSISDPDLRFDDATATWQLYYATSHAMTFADTGTQMIRHATSSDASAFDVADAPALVASSDTGAWDHINTETPSVAFNPDADAAHRYLMVYSGAAQAFPFNGGPFADYAIGAAFSADGDTFTRVAAADSPHGQDGLVLTGADAYPGATGAIVADPEIVYVAGTYHLWFSSFACDGTTCQTNLAFGVGHATSTDGVHWTVAEAPVRSLLTATIDPNSGGGQPSVLYDAAHCRWEMWLTADKAGDTASQPALFNNMAGVWHASSMDGVTWHTEYTDQRDLTWSATEPGEHLGLLTGADVGQQGNVRFMVYVGFDDQNVPANFFVFDHSAQGFESGVFALDVAARN